MGQVLAAGATRTGPYWTTSTANSSADVSKTRKHTSFPLSVCKSPPSQVTGNSKPSLDATGHVSFRQPHCPYCLTARHEHYTLYQHQVLEAKLLGPGNLTLSMASEFIENSDANRTLNGEARQQD